MSLVFVILKFNHAHLKFTVYGCKQASKHTHARAQCSSTSVGLAQARPNYQEHIRFWCNLAICWRAFNHCVAFRMLGVCGECNCVSSMPNVCCAGHHWFVHKFDDDSYFLFSSGEGLKEQLSIFTTQALLELPEVPMSTSFIPGLSPLAGILLNCCSHLTATCVRLFAVDL